MGRRRSNRTETYKKLLAVSRELTTHLHLSDVTQVVCKGVRDLAAADGATFILRDGDQVHYVDENAIEPLWKSRRFAIQECLSGLALNECRPVVVPDVYAETRVSINMYKGTFVRSLAIVPLRLDGDPPGAIGCYWRQTHRPDDHHLELLQSLADSAVTALSNVQHYEQMKAARLEAERRADALLRLEEASAGLLAIDPETTLYDRLIGVICGVTRAPRGILWLTSDEDREPVLRSEWSYGFRKQPRDEFDRQNLDFLRCAALNSELPAARSARSLKPIPVTDLKQDVSWSTFETFYRRAGIQSMLAVPLRGRAKTLGSVTLFWHEPDPCRDEATLRIAEVITNQAAASMDIAALIGELGRSNRLKDEFIAILSHELRSPLNAIVGYAHILSRSAEAEKSPLLKKAAEVIRRNATAQAQLISDLLDLSRLQTGKLALEKQTFALSPVISSAMEAVLPDALNRRIKLKMEAASESLLVNGDPVRVQQIAWNLLNNAVKFTPDSRSVAVKLNRDGDRARLDVIDRGQGIEPEFVAHVFEMFRQADPSSVRKQGGLGIGLALVRQLAELHGGQVEAHSDGLGIGSRFTVWLPLAAEPPRAAAEDGRDSSVRLTGISVLVVDDSRDTVEMLRQLLELEGAEVRFALSAEESLQLAEDQAFDVILSDISMPGMDGHELLRRLRCVPGLADIPAIAMTGFGQSHDMQRSMESGFVAHLTKPVQPKDLLDILQSKVKPRRA